MGWIWIQNAIQLILISNSDISGTGTVLIWTIAFKMFVTVGLSSRMIWSRYDCSVTHLFISVLSNRKAFPLFTVLPQEFVIFSLDKAFICRVTVRNLLENKTNFLPFRTSYFQHVPDADSLVKFLFF